MVDRMHPLKVVGRKETRQRSKLNYGIGEAQRINDTLGNLMKIDST